MKQGVYTGKLEVSVNDTVLHVQDLVVIQTLHGADLTANFLPIGNESRHIEVKSDRAGEAKVVVVPVDDDRYADINLTNAVTEGRPWIAAGDILTLYLVPPLSMTEETKLELNKRGLLPTYH